MAFILESTLDVLVLVSKSGLFDFPPLLFHIRYQELFHDLVFCWYFRLKIMQSTTFLGRIFKSTFVWNVYDLFRNIKLDVMNMTENTVCDFNIEPAAVVGKEQASKFWSKRGPGNAQNSTQNDIIYLHTKKNQQSWWVEPLGSNIYHKSNIINYFILYQHCVI